MNAGFPRSAYGISWRGLGRVPELSAAVTPTADPVNVRVETRSAAPLAHPVDDDHGCWRLADGRILHLDRKAREAVFHGAPIAPDLLAHPYLAPVAITFNRWAGREAFHAGAFVDHDHGWAVLGPQTAGKSTLLGCLAERGTTVLSDDVVITDGASVFAGPRCVDLRDRLPYGDLEVRPAREGSRWRAPLPPAPEQVPLGGWLFLEWGEAVELEPIGPTELIGRLARRRARRGLRSDPGVLLALAAAPAWTLRRPRNWGAVTTTLAELDRVLSEASSSMVGDGGLPLSRAGGVAR